MEYSNQDSVNQPLYYRHHLNKSLKVTLNKTFFVNSPHPRVYPVFQKTGNEGVILNDLEQLHETLCNAVNQYSKVFAVRIDLHFPTKEYWPDSFIPGNEVIDSFKKYLNYKIQRDRIKAKSSGDYNSCTLRSFWVREVPSATSRPHYHIILLLNGSVYNRIGKSKKGFNKNTLWGKIVSAWIQANKILSPEHNEYLVHLPENACFMLSRESVNHGHSLSIVEAQNYISENYEYNDFGILTRKKYNGKYLSQSVDEFMFRGSYLCKAGTKEYNNNIHRVGCTRK